MSTPLTQEKERDPELYSGTAGTACDTYTVRIAKVSAYEYRFTLTNESSMHRNIQYMSRIH
jgi:hypothetical protein